MQIQKISPSLSVSPQITAEDVAALAQAGFRSIINNRPDGESDDQPDTAAIATAAAAVFGAPAPAGVVGLLVLIFATFKARLILDRYLGLSEAPIWRRGFAAAIVGFMLLLAALHLAATAPT